MSKRRKIDYHEFAEPRQDEFPDLFHTASAAELTGVMHKTPISGEEWKNLQELHPMGIPLRELSGTAAQRMHAAAEAAHETAGEGKSGEHPEDPETPAR